MVLTANQHKHHVQKCTEGFISDGVYIVYWRRKMFGKKNQLKRLSDADFNAIFDLIRDGSKAPETRPVKGSECGTKTYQEQ